MIFFGGKLSLLGGSWYCLLVGIIYALSSIFLWKNSRWSIAGVMFALMATLAWSLYEVGGDYWGLFPRLLAPIAIACLVLLAMSAGNKPYGKRIFAAGVALGAAFFVFLGFAFTTMPLVAPHSEVAYKVGGGKNDPLNWAAYSRDVDGIRYSPFDQISRENVKDLALAWTYRTRRNTVNLNAVDQNTPLQIENILYTCTPENSVHAIDATTGQRKWVFDAHASTYAWARCRGLGYYEDKIAAAGQPGRGGVCARRIIGNTVDGRLFALDADTGKPCPDFGKRGMVDLRAGMGAMGPGYYYQTSAPLVADGKIVVGGWVSDNQKVGEPSGAIRAFDVHSGALVWAWDPGNPDVSRTPLNGDSYTLGTPNMWTHAAYDPALGLVFAPMGNAGTDYFNADRPKHSLKFNSALVAIDIHTGKPKWSFQTVHDDLWDYDIPSQPALLDMKNERGEMVPTALVFTKRGQIFALDRRDGSPVSRVEERPVPTKGSIPENTVSPTQPYSVGMPLIGQGPVTEASAWGMTMFDQLLCRIDFKKLRYEGDFTPPGLDWSLSSPGALGGMNWGSASYDPVNRRLFVNDIRLANTRRIIKRDEYNEITKVRKPTPDGHGLGPMENTPYAVETRGWNSMLGVPCQQPPLGTITAIDLESRSIAWQIRAGTAEQLGPLGVKLGLPMKMGMPTYAGTSTTAGGLVFFSGFQDYYLRAYDAETGKEVWKTPLPVGSSATPMTYISPINHKQYVVVSVGGSAHSPDVGDYVMAFALPDGQK